MAPHENPLLDSLMATHVIGGSRAVNSALAAPHAGGIRPARANAFELGALAVEAC